MLSRERSLSGQGDIHRRQTQGWQHVKKRIKSVINKKNISKKFIFNLTTDNMSLICKNMVASQKVTFSLINDSNISFIIP